MPPIINAINLVQRLSASKPMLLRLAVRNMAGWNKDFKPALIPQNEKDMASAAKRYNLLPEEYRPYADNGTGEGDYPDLGHSLGIEAKDNFYPYDFPEHKRNFNEVLHAEIDLYGEDRYSQPAPLRFPMSYYWEACLGVLSFCFILYYWLEDKKMFRPVAAKQYPAEGVVHYTFERLD